MFERIGSGWMWGGLEAAWDAIPDRYKPRKGRRFIYAAIVCYAINLLWLVSMEGSDGDTWVVADCWTVLFVLVMLFLVLPFFEARERMVERRTRFHTKRVREWTARRAQSKEARERGD